MSAPASTTAPAAVPADRPAIPRQVVLTLAALSALATLSTNIMLPSLPEISQRLSLSASQANSLLSVFFVVFALAQLLVGPWSDRIGRHRLVVGGIAVFIGGTLLCAIADGLPMLLAGRAIQALGVAAASVLARAAARDRYDGTALTQLLGLIMVVMAAAPGFSPLIGGLVHQVFGWRGVFVALALAAVAIGLAWTRIIGETLPASRRVSRSVAAVTVDYGRLLADARFIAPAASVALIMGALFALFAASPLILMQSLGFNPLQVGLYFAGTVFVVFGAGTLAPKLSARYGPANVVRAGIGLASIGGLALLAVSTSGTLSLASYVAATCVFLFGMGITSPVGTALTMSPFATVAGQASALLGFLQMAAAAVTTTLSAALIGVSIDPLSGSAAVSPADALAIVMLGASLLALLIIAFGARSPKVAA